mmetsp:Transcript_39592/g.75812  ORF Transcript_39592/g.75812 Transcript_39592/m.75812 type:complete len:337 (-) Transcript_39592:377-1387(-)
MGTRTSGEAQCGAWPSPGGSHTSRWTKWGSSRARADAPATSRARTRTNGSSFVPARARRARCRRHPPPPHAPLGARRDPPGSRLRGPSRPRPRASPNRAWNSCSTTVRQSSPRSLQAAFRPRTHRFQHPQPTPRSRPSPQERALSPERCHRHTPLLILQPPPLILRSPPLILWSPLLILRSLLILQTPTPLPPQMWQLMRRARLLEAQQRRWHPLQRRRRRRWKWSRLGSWSQRRPRTGFRWCGSWSWTSPPCFAGCTKPTSNWRSLQSLRNPPSRSMFWTPKGGGGCCRRRRYGYRCPWPPRGLPSSDRRCCSGTPAFSTTAWDTRLRRSSSTWR